MVLVVAARPVGAVRLGHLGQSQRQQAGVTVAVVLVPPV